MKNRGQISLEIALLVSSMVLVSIIGGYYFIKNSHDALSGMNNTCKEGERFINISNNKSLEYTNKIAEVFK
ncbi:class III signal peptide-containing protein [Methanocaldococcus sp.]